MALIITVLVLVAMPAGAAAKPGFSVIGPQRWSEFALPATNGYRIRVSAIPATKKRLPNVFISASKGQRYEVEYLAPGLSTEKGVIKAKLPGVGRIAVRFNQLKVNREPVAGNCKGRAGIIRHGIFVGTIELHGEHGYTSVGRHSAPGEIRQSFRQVCDQREPGHEGTGNDDSPHLKTLLAGREGRRALSFSVSRFNFGPRFGGPSVSFSASSSMQRHGFFVFASVSAEGEPATFLTPDPAGALEDASVTPPAPFHGSATFHLDSPSSSSWTGALSVELPGVGKCPARRHRLLVGPVRRHALHPNAAPERAHRNCLSQVRSRSMAETVLVTGGSGFLAGWCMELLEQGYDVRTTVRDLSRESEVRGAVSTGGQAGAKIAVLAADLTSDDGWEEAVAGCDYVLHVASPFPPVQPKDPDELIVPAREGTRRVLRAALAGGVKRTVVTSSVAAIAGGAKTPGLLTEDDWTDLDFAGLSPYVRSKTIAEQAAWELVREEGAEERLATVTPAPSSGRC